MEISKVLTVSTGSVSETSRKLLENDQTWEKDMEPIPLPFVSYAKGSYGWFLCISNYYAAEDEERANCPDDLRRIVEYALLRGCDWLCLDSDAPLFDP